MESPRPTDALGWQPVAACSRSPAGELLAEGNDVLRGNVGMMRARELEQGRVLVWGDEWITYNSEWQTRPDYQVAQLWQNALAWLGPPDRCQLRSF